MSDSGGLGSAIKLESVAKAAGFSRVYWIDDQFSEAGPQLVSRVMAKIAAIVQMEETPRAEAIRALQLSGIANDDSLKVSGLLRSKKGLGHALLKELESQISELDTLPEAEQIPADLNSEQVELIAKAFPDVKMMCLSEWKEEASTILGEADENALFLIDHDFSLEEGGTKTSGEDILRTIVSEPTLKCCCILFTHGIPVGNEHHQNKKVATSIGAEDRRHRFSVVCKERITLPTDKGEAPLARAFQDAFIRDWCHAIVNAAQSIFQTAFESTKNDLLDLSFDQVSSAFFHRSTKDGTSEFDVLIRVMMLAGRVALEDEQPQKAELLKKLAKIRTLMGVGDYAPEKPPALTGNLANLRTREIWDPGSVINAIRAPLSCGDVFEQDLGRGKTRKFVLIGQPCQLAIRSDGSRRNNEALFLNVAGGSVDPSRGYPFDFPEKGKQWISYDLVFPVNLYLLDFASFNENGSVSVSKDDVASPLLLPGVKKRLENAVAFLKSYKDKQEVKFRYRRIALSEELGKADTVIKEGKIVLPFTRIGRIRSPHAEALLGGFSVFHTRMAFDYDFSKAEEREIKPPDKALQTAPPSPVEPAPA
jgi:hypothetical protein